MVGTKDEVYLDLIMNEDLFSPIIQVLKNNNGRYNLLDSAILEMFEFIQNEDLLPLMNHILTNFGPFLDSIDYVDTFKVMRQKKEALHDSIGEDTLIPNRSIIETYPVSNDAEDEDDIQMDEEDCDDELEPQLKKKKTK